MGSEVKVLLINPPVTSIYGGTPPYGLMYIASVLEKNGIKVEIFNRNDLDYKQYKLALLNHITKNLPDIVGFTCYLGDVADVKEMCLEIKKISSDIKIVVGGFHPSMFPQQFQGFANYVVIGEGEITMLEFTKALESKKEISNVNGLAILGKNMKLTPPRELTDLQTLPFPAYHLVDMNFYTKVTDGRLRGVLINCGALFTSRGCPFKCTFCPTTHYLGLNQRLRNPQDVVNEIEFLINEYDLNGIYFLDETFTLNKKHVTEICDELIKRKLDVVWGCETRANLLGEGLLKKMKMAGCIQIDFGVESGSQRILNLLKKGITIEQVKNTFMLCRKNGIRTFANYLTNIPDETVEERNRTIEFANELKANRFTYNIFVPYPGTKLNEDFGIEVKEKDYKYFFTLKKDANMKYITENYNFTPDKKDLDELSNEAIQKIKHKSLYPFILNKCYIKSLIRSGRKKEYFNWVLNKCIYLMKKKLKNPNRIN